MVAIAVENLGITYDLLHKASRAAHAARSQPTGGIIGTQGGRQFVTALDGVNFTLNAGDRLGVVGPNGAGKTTLLKVLYGIYEPTRGHVNITGRVDALFNINLGFRRDATGRRNIILRGLINGRSKADIKACMDEIIEFSELGDFIDLPMKSYSQGMAARLAFAVATTLEPEIMLMDEWIGAGDARFQTKAQERMDKLANEAGIIVLASHNDLLVDRTCNKVLALDKGRIAFFGEKDCYYKTR